MGLTRLGSDITSVPLLIPVEIERGLLFMGYMWWLVWSAFFCFLNCEKLLCGG